MKLLCSVLFALLLSAGTLDAQGQGTMSDCVSSVPFEGTAPQAPPTNTVCEAQVQPHCPIAMRAQHLADGEMVKTGNARPRGIGQWLHLTLIAPDSRRITKATFTIRGSSPKNRMMQTLGNGNNSSDASAALTAEFTNEPDRHDLADLWVPGMTAVQSIEVSSLTYADGSTWKLSGDLGCRVAPDGLMPVSR